LRSYQRDAIDGVYRWFDESAGNPLVVVPTGGGKSVIAGEFVREVIEALPRERIMVVTHVKELIGQNYTTFLKWWPEGQLRAGIYSAGLKRRDTRSQVLFCGVQSVYRRIEELGYFDLVIVDEAHLIPPRGWGMYQQLFAGLKAINPRVKVIGLTATPFRTDTGKLDEGDDRLFHGIAYECSIPKMIEDEWLSPVTNRGVKAEIDTSQVGIRAGEFKADELEKAATIDGLVVESVNEMIARASDRKAWLIFCCGIDHAKQVCIELDRRGVVNTCVFGTTHIDDRDERIEAYRRGEITAMVNVNVLTTGFDVPHVDLIALMRPTQSPGLYVQMVGRGLRPAEGKENCLVLDYGTNVLRHGPIDQVRPAQPGKGDGDAPMKKCPDCLLLVYSATTICPECGYVFPVRRGQPDHDATPDEDALLLAGERDDRIKRWAVHNVFYKRWESNEDKPDTLCVEYLCGIRKWVSEWVCFDHPEGTYPRRKANGWWHDHGGRQPPPADVSEALARIKLREIPAPHWVTVDTVGKYPEVKGIRYEDDEKWKADAEEGAVHDHVIADDIPF
jgi:DNA repair protein RadD